MPDVPVKTTFPDFLEPSSGSAARSIMNRRKGRADAVAELEDAVIFLAARRKLIIPGMCRRNLVLTADGSRDWHFTLAREPYTAETIVHVIVDPAGAALGTAQAFSSYGSSNTVTFGQAADGSDEPIHVPLRLEIGDGSDSDVGEEEVYVRVTKSPGASPHVAVLFIGFEPVPMDTIEVTA